MHLFRSLQFVFRCVFEDWNLKKLNNCNVYIVFNSELMEGILSKEGHFEEGHLEEGHLEKGHFGEGHLREGHLRRRALRKRTLEKHFWKGKRLMNQIQVCVLNCAI